MWYLYLLECNDKSIYTGITKNFEKRFKAHTSGRGSKYVAARLPIENYSVGCLNTEDRAVAQYLEHKIKKLSHKQKQILTMGPRTGYNSIASVCNWIKLSIEQEIKELEENDSQSTRVS